MTDIVDTCCVCRVEIPPGPDCCSKEHDEIYRRALELWDDLYLHILDDSGVNVMITSTARNMACYVTLTYAGYNGIQCLSPMNDETQLWADQVLKELENSNYLSFLG